MPWSVFQGWLIEQHGDHKLHFMNRLWTSNPIPSIKLARRRPQIFPFFVTRNGEGMPVILPIDERTDLETLILSNSLRFWELVESARRSKRTPIEELPDSDDDAAWAKLAAEAPEANPRPKTFPPV